MLRQIVARSICSVSAPPAKGQDGARSGIEDFHGRVVAGLADRYRTVAQQRREIIGHAFDDHATATDPAGQRLAAHLLFVQKSV